MAPKGEPLLIDIDAEELVFKLRLNSIPGREAITSLMPTIVEMGFTLNIVSMCSFILYQFIANLLYCMVTILVITYSMHSILYSYKCGYKTGY